MPTLNTTLRRIALNQSSRVGLLEQLSDEKLTLWQGLAAQIQCALFEDTPAADTLITDVSNIDNVNLVVRKVGPSGVILFSIDVPDSELHTISYAEWLAETGQHLTFDISDLDTTQIIPNSGFLPIYFVVTITTKDNIPYIAGFGYGEIVDVGYIENPVSSDYITGRTPIVGGRLLTNLDLNGFRLVDSSRLTEFEEGEVALTSGQLGGTIDFQFEKADPDNIRFDYLYVKDRSSSTVEVIQIVTGDIGATSCAFVLSAAPSTANCVLYWGVKPKDFAEPAVQPLARYALDSSLVHLIGTESIAGVKTFTDSARFTGTRITTHGIVIDGDGTNPYDPTGDLGGFHILAPFSKAGVRSGGYGSAKWITNDGPSPGHPETFLQGTIAIEPSSDPYARGFRITCQEQSVTWRTIFLQDEINGEGYTKVGGMFQAGYNGDFLHIWRSSNNQIDIQVEIDKTIQAIPNGSYSANSNLRIQAWGGLCEIGQMAVANPTLLNGWSNLGGGYTPVAFWKDSNRIVHLRGVISGGTATAGTVLFTLPAGYRPITGTEGFTVLSGDAPAMIQVTYDGDVKLYLGVTNYVALSGICFRTE